MAFIGSYWLLGTVAAHGSNGRLAQQQLGPISPPPRTDLDIVLVSTINYFESLCLCFCGRVGNSVERGRHDLIYGLNLRTSILRRAQGRAGERVFAVLFIRDEKQS